uniref:Uncharacterized protein n=1 Tax=Chromera velia CCMP2878 TaxID=1169474 RepID=A0A0G4IC52_9ALVE|eukprot:Cvel_13015.t1-p1 / transcript=Cvel_13015.t1 / gene=Cvel_13015 / organism=Chromera_velia_CCMP2878 / gene_product=hypothetical protein / transcript_product=hypothetical protein / location=Cvel_scaffold873:48058-48507(+) / protein_length=150 / sequence_SO=supercontig / SO=protein_coding / is_pseudo=false
MGEQAVCSCCMGHGLEESKLAKEHGKDIVKRYFFRAAIPHLFNLAFVRNWVGEPGSLPSASGRARGAGKKGNEGKGVSRGSSKWKVGMKVRLTGLSREILNDAIAVLCQVPEGADSNEDARCHVKVLQPVRAAQAFPEAIAIRVRNFVQI